MTLLPLGRLRKSEVRKIADTNGFSNANKHDSQDICFVPDGDYASFIEHFTGETFEAGSFVDKDNQILGTHNGIIRYTIGQRKGLGITSAEPLYVCDIMTEENKIVLGCEQDLYSKSFLATNINLISCDKIDGPMKVKAKVRYRQKEQPATVEQINNDTLRIEFDTPQRAITKGQSVVLYDGDYVIGGGIITF
jgi:tRNA-specific 2-thiouridylase